MEKNESTYGTLFRIIGKSISDSDPDGSSACLRAAIDIDEILQEYADLQVRCAAAENCSTCDGIPHVSGFACICGGTNRRIDEVAGLRLLVIRGDERNERLRDGIEAAWGVIAKASHGVWDLESPDWREAAEKWRDEYWNSVLTDGAVGEGAQQ